MSVAFYQLALAALVTLTIATGVSTQSDRQTRAVPLPPGRSVSVNVTIGTVQILAADRADAAIEIVRTARGAAGLAHIPLTIHEDDKDVRIDVLQSDGGTDPSFRSDITLRVPRAAVVKSVHIMEGRLAISGLHGEIRADVRRGPIEASDVQGIVRLETGIGNVTANRMTLVPDGLLRLRTFNGDVRLTLAQRPTNARVMALALNGTIRSDIPLQTKEAWGPRWGEATLGTGEPVISIDIVTGTIDIKVGG